MVKKILTSPWTKVTLFALSLLPAVRLVWKALHAGLGANPIELVTHETGDWILIFLVLTLTITPARKVLGWPELIRFRRMLGLFAFFYAFLHFSTWIGLDKFFDLREMLQDVAKRRFITVGFIGFVLMIPLALTSTAGSIRRLGGKRWRMLHRLIYGSAIAGVVHYYWLVKSDVRKPVGYGVLVGLLLAYRVGAWLIDKKGGAPVHRTPARASAKELTTAGTPGPTLLRNSSFHPE
jgi:sulfoxide reductase heme-binding subunit YedZ